MRKLRRYFLQSSTGNDPHPLKYPRVEFLLSLCLILSPHCMCFCVLTFLCFVHASRNNSTTQADYSKTTKTGPPAAQPPPPGVPFKPVPPPKPKNYRPPIQGAQSGNQWENGVSFWQNKIIFLESNKILSRNLLCLDHPMDTASTLPLPIFITPDRTLRRRPWDLVLRQFIVVATINSTRVLVDTSILLSRPMDLEKAWETTDSVGIISTMDSTCIDLLVLVSSLSFCILSNSLNDKTKTEGKFGSCTADYLEILITWLSW